MRFLPALTLTLISLTATAGNGYIRLAEKGVSVGVNHSGTNIFGYNGRSGDESQQTWIFDTETKATSLYPTGVYDYDTEGQLLWLTDGQTGVGTYRDDFWTTSVNDGLGGSISDYPLNTACIWKNGSRISLDHNRWEDASTFVGQDGTLPNAGNGFYAMKMTEDESLIVGYLKAFSYMLPVRWTRNDDGTYTSTMMHREVGQFFFSWVGASADCSRIILNTSQSGGFSYIWDGEAEPWIFSYTELGSRITDAHLTALSPNGRYAIMNCERNGATAHGVYDFDTQKVSWIPLPEGASSSNWFAANVITDRADGFICDYNYQLHYFNTELGINIPFRSYIQAYGSGVEIESGAIPSKALVRMVSADGRTICGNDIQFSLEYTGWMIRLPEEQPMLFALRNCEAMYSSTDRILLKWDEPTLPAGASVKHYRANIDGTDQILEAAKGADGKMRAEIACSLGKHSVTLLCVATDKDGRECESVTQSFDLEISDNTSLFFFEDLCDAEIDETVMAYKYIHDTFSPLQATDSAVLNFRLDAGDFCNLTPFWYTCGFANTAWDSYMESRWFDATDQTDDFYFTWQERNLPINDATTLDVNNLFLLECTTDGENWTVLHESNGRDNNAKWNVQSVDLSALAGKCFRLRFHAVGAGRHACEWRLDYYGLLPSYLMYDAPAGLMATEQTNDGVKLAWKNNRGEYEVSYNYNSPMTYNTNVGNDGRPLYVACDYGPDKFRAFEGKYITAVSSMLYELDYEDGPHTKLQAVIFDEAGNELSRGTLDEDAPWFEYGVSTGMPIHHIDLDTPVLIQPGRTYRVSILITDYPADVCPIWYFSASDDFIPGVTDLYSDDDLQSWNSLAMLFSTESTEDFNLYGRCIFNIRPCISDEPVVSDEPYCQEQWFYQVYRNGEILPTGIAYYTQQSALDETISEATYTVRSFRRNGMISKMSEPFYFKPAGVADATADAASDLKISTDASNLYIMGDFDYVSLYNLMGAKVASSRVVSLDSLPRGVYVIVAHKDGKAHSVKWIH